MLLSSIFLFLLSNAISLKREISIYYSRIGMIVQIYCIYLCYNNLYITYLDLGIGLFGGLFNITSLSLIFETLIFILSFYILNLTGFYPRKFLYPKFLDKKYISF